MCALALAVYDQLNNFDNTDARLALGWIIMTCQLSVLLLILIYFLVQIRTILSKILKVLIFNDSIGRVNIVSPAGIERMRMQN